MPSIAGVFWHATQANCRSLCCVRWYVRSRCESIVRNVRILLKGLALVGGIGVIATAVGLCWFYLYTSDVPGFAELRNFAPQSVASATDRCSGAVIQVVPPSFLGKNLQNATRAAEGNSDERLAVQIARGLFCNLGMPTLRRQVLEYKAAALIRSEFPSEQLLTIYLNRAYFGNDLIGVESASLHYYGKRASELDVAQAALIAGLIKAPGIYSPERHAERAKKRRDEVIAAMLTNGSITVEQADAAEKSAIP